MTEPGSESQVSLTPGGFRCHSTAWKIIARTGSQNMGKCSNTDVKRKRQGQTVGTLKLPPPF